MCFYVTIICHCILFQILSTEDGRLTVASGIIMDISRSNVTVRILLQYIFFRVIKKKLRYKCTHCSHRCTTVSLKTIWMYSRLSNRLISHIIKLLGFLFQALKASREQPFFYGTRSPSWSLAHWQGWIHDIICNHEVTKDHNGIYLPWQFFYFVAPVAIWMIVEYVLYACLCWWRFNLIQLFLQNEHSFHQRRMIVDLEVSEMLNLYKLERSAHIATCVGVNDIVHLCRLLDSIVDVYLVKTLQYRISGLRKIWIMISAEP